MRTFNGTFKISKSLIATFERLSLKICLRYEIHACAHVRRCTRHKTLTITAWFSYFHFIIQFIRFHKRITCSSSYCWLVLKLSDTDKLPNKLSEDRCVLATCSERKVSYHPTQDREWNKHSSLSVRHVKMVWSFRDWWHFRKELYWILDN